MLKMIIVTTLVLLTQGTALAEKSKPVKKVVHMVRFDTDGECPAGGLLLYTTLGDKVLDTKLHCDSQLDAEGAAKEVVANTPKTSQKLIHNARFTSHENCPAGGLILYVTRNDLVIHMSLNCDTKDYTHGP
jgi:hypothetical protein